jgi:hypothetical protein
MTYWFLFNNERKNDVFLPKTVYVVLPWRTAGSYLLPWPDFREPAVLMRRLQSIIPFSILS